MGLIRGRGKAARRTLKTVDQVFDALGGNRGVRAITGASPQAVNNWRRVAGKFPPDRFLQFSTALRQQRLDAVPALFGQHEPLGRDQHAAALD
jgi:hypothetical protein